MKALLFIDAFVAGTPIKLPARVRRVFAICQGLAQLELSRVVEEHVGLKGKPAQDR